MSSVKYAGPMVERVAGTGGVGGQRVVVLLGEEVFHADKDNPAHFDLVEGITAGAFGAGVTGCVQVYGRMIDPSWSWTPDVTLWLGNNGLLTETPPASGFTLRVARAVSATEIFIDLYPPVREV